MKNIFYLILGSVLLFSCSQEEFNIPNTNQPDASKVLSSAADFKNFNTTNHTSLFSTQVGFSGVFFRGMSDQFTTTNAYRGFWAFCDQPRRQIDNSTSNSALGVQTGGPWDSFNAIISKSNIVIKNIEIDGNTIKDSDGNDLTNQELAGAYFDKGVSLGYLSMIYNQAYIVKPGETDLKFSTYQEVLAEAVSSLEKAISLASGTFDYTLYTGASSLDADSFKKLAYSYLARFSIGVARTDAEAKTLNYDKILEYADKAITSNFYPTSKEEIFFNNLQDWSLYLLGSGAGYMPTDIKIQHLFDPSYPTDYPTDDTVVLPAANSDDPRLASYYEYVGDKFGYLRAARGRQLFSSYRHIRFFDNNQEDADGLAVQVFPKAEIDYIKAEAYYRKGDYAAAVQALDASPRKTVGNQSTTESESTVLNAILYENSIELDLNSGIAVNWAFMRRHDFLQKGTPTMYPVPASELEIAQLPSYTYGSESKAGEEGTASGSNDWRQLTLEY